MLSTLHTDNLYKFDEVMSALQKAVRRCKPKEALFWAGELENSGYGAAMFSRLFTIMAEDLCIAEPRLSIEMYPLYEEWRGLQKKNPTAAKLISMRVVLALAKGHKNRMVNNAICFVSFLTQPTQNWQKKLPDQSIIDLVQNTFPFGLFTGVDKDTLDLKSALIYMAGAIENGEATNALFFANLINMDWSAVDNRALLVTLLGHKVLKTSKKLASNASMYSWYLMLTMAKKDAQLYELIKNLYLLFIKDIGTPRLNLAFAVILMALHDKIDYSSISIPSETELTQEQKDIYYNQATDIKQRRQFAVPDYAIDKHTSRGKGSPKESDNIEALRKMAKKKQLDIKTWTREEIAKSHGIYKKFVEKYDKATKKESRMSHFFDVAAVVTNMRSGVQGMDPYLPRARKFYLATEKKYGYRAAKSTQILKEMYPILLKNQDLWKYEG